MTGNQTFGLLAAALVSAGGIAGAMVASWVNEQDHHRYLEREVPKRRSRSLTGRGR